MEKISNTGSEPANDLRRREPNLIAGELTPTKKAHYLAGRVLRKTWRVGDATQARASEVSKHLVPVVLCGLSFLKIWLQNMAQCLFFCFFCSCFLCSPNSFVYNFSIRSSSRRMTSATSACARVVVCAAFYFTSQLAYTLHMSHGFIYKSG